MRITPACAGSRCHVSPQAGFRQDHPRIRGEQYFGIFYLATEQGSPPHTRGAVICPLSSVIGLGITPAYAGSSALCRSRGFVGRDHPRIRGEQSITVMVKFLRLGSPPHTRGADRKNLWSI